MQQLLDASINIGLEGQVLFPGILCATVSSAEVDREANTIKSDARTPAAICWRLLACFSSSSWLKTWSFPGSTRVAALNQMERVYGERTAFI